MAKRIPAYTLLKVLLICTIVLCQRSSNAQTTFESALANGEIYKISTDENGVYRISYEFLQSELGIELSNIDPRNIQLLGNGGGLLPENVDDPRIDDLKENRIIVVGEEDGRFDPSDYILFYGQAPDQKIWNPILKRFEAPKNIYSDQVIYFLKIGEQPGLRIATGASPSNGSTYNSNTYDHHERLEEEKINLLDDFNSASGTGQSWFGDQFKGLRDRSYEISIPQLRNDELGHFKVVFAARGGSTSTLNTTIEGQSFSRLIGSVNLGDSEGRFARIGILENFFTPQDEVINIDIEYPENSGNNIGWLDYIELNTRRQLSYDQSTLFFSDQESIRHDVSTFTIINASSDLTVWDITNPFSPEAVSANLSGTDLSFDYNSSELRSFIGFDINRTLIPKSIGQIENQNLHSIQDVDMVVLYPHSLIDAGELFVDHRANHSSLDIALVDIEQLFNEFSSGAPDPVAIRDFAKMLHNRSPKFKYLLLLGDASFDFKNLKDLPINSNLIPTYETKESLDPIRGFPSDDFFGLLSAGEGTNLRGALDIAIGRLPAKDSQEAMTMVQKIIDYDTSPDRLGDWINQVTLVADDEDFNIHLNQADQIAQSVIDNYPQYNVEKIYLDAFKQVSTAGGELYPEVQEAINNALNKGTTVINYMGHGGATGLAQERILTLNDVNNWSNQNRLALFVTATCSFTGYDDPNFVTAGERAILNPNGGAIALFTTVRAVYSSSNERLTKAVFDNLFKPIDGVVPPIGEILKNAKNSNAADTLGINARKFLLIGDPSMHLIQPAYDVVTSAINNRPISGVNRDTLSALEPIHIKAFIASNGTIVNDFNGEVDIVIYDKARSVSTLGQDNTSFVRTFETRKNIVFKGSASVRNGLFEYEFIVPQDIDFEFGQGKISYYAKSTSNKDATGYSTDIIVGGISETTLANDMPPTVIVYLDTENFENGGITGPNPTLLIQLADDYGINIVGNSIGHDITAVLDNDTRRTFILNEFYESELDNTKAGTVRFPLKDLKEGQHSIEVKAWDIANNSATSKIEFVVATNIESAINAVINYPNPVLDQTTFRIDHNISSGLLDIYIDIFAIDGRLVKNLRYSSGTNNGLIDNLVWDGKDNSGLRLETGIYLFQVYLDDSSDPSKSYNRSKLEKLVLIR